MVVSQFSFETPRCYAGVIMHDLAIVVPVTQLLDNYFTIRASRVTRHGKPLCFVTFSGGIETHTDDIFVLCPCSDNQPISSTLQNLSVE